ncbi:glycoside hydrolase family 99-like domain-containing protein [Nocardioides sp. B-3]|uniref:glycoside hydrolase family 99-like domain-containing protein n=1 Tax=Nocardioides sp. B-3 TaxID=2895565 RepID=UPI002152492D|nr:glycoside hydrolase family 99-like domain-containing protein [Nocardioides sp. B-3]
MRYPAVAPGWDNTARRQENATVYVGSTPMKYGNWLKAARRREAAARADRGLVFVNAWNEWAEGAYLEPDAGHGTAYLEATLPSSGGGLEVASVADAHGALFWSYPHLRSLALAFAGSILAVRRRAKNHAARRRRL